MQLQHWFLFLVVIWCLMQYVLDLKCRVSLYLHMDFTLTVSDRMTASLGCSGISAVFSSLSNSSWCLLFLFSFFFSFLSFSGSSRSSLSWDLQCSFFGKRGSKANLSDEREKRNQMRRGGWRWPSGGCVLLDKTSWLFNITSLLWSLEQILALIWHLAQTVNSKARFWCSVLSVMATIHIS